MATKPMSTPTWATDAGTTVEPNTAKKAIGWVDGERPPAKHFNWWQNLAWQWFEYLDDGALSGDHSIDGALSTTGNVTIGGSVISPLRLKETSGATDRFILRVPTGWDTAASADATVDVPPQEQVFANAEMGLQGVSSFTPTVNVSGATLSLQAGLAIRTANSMHIMFRVAWTGGSASGNLLVQGLPTIADTVRGTLVPASTDLFAPPSGAARDTVTTAIYHVIPTAGSGTQVALFTNAGAQVAQYTPGQLVGSIVVPVSG